MFKSLYGLFLICAVGCTTTPPPPTPPAPVAAFAFLHCHVLQSMAVIYSDGTDVFVTQEQVNQIPALADKMNALSDAAAHHYEINSTAGCIDT